MQTPWCEGKIIRVGFGLCLDDDDQIERLPASKAEKRKAWAKARQGYARKIVGDIAAYGVEAAYFFAFVLLTCVFCPRPGLAVDAANIVTQTIWRCDFEDGSPMGWQADGGPNAGLVRTIREPESGSLYVLEINARTGATGVVYAKCNLTNVNVVVAEDMRLRFKGCCFMPIQKLSVGIGANGTVYYVGLNPRDLRENQWTEFRSTPLTTCARTNKDGQVNRLQAGDRIQFLLIGFVPSLWQATNGKEPASILIDEVALVVNTKKP